VFLLNLGRASARPFFRRESIARRGIKEHNSGQKVGNPVFPCEPAGILLGESGEKISSATGGIEDEKFY
jgi:hypothetical protein